MKQHRVIEIKTIQKHEVRFHTVFVQGAKTCAAYNCTRPIEHGEEAWTNSRRGKTRLYIHYRCVHKFVHVKLPKIKVKR